MSEQLEIGLKPSQVLRILYTADLHGNVEKMKYLSTVLKQERAKEPGCLLFDSGDWSKGSPLCDRFRGKPMAEIMEYLKYDAVALGEADLSWGIRGLSRLAEEVSFPFLCANISGELPLGFKAYVIKRLQGLSVCIIGISPMLRLPERHLTMIPPQEGLENVLRDKESGADLVILLSHCGIDQDREIARKNLAVNVIIGGHSHIKLDEPEKVGSTLIVHGGAYGDYLGSLDLNLGSTITLKRK